MLGRAKTMMRGWVASPSAAAVPYSVACANGHRLRGERTEGYQALRCPSCGEAVFILPQSPLPEPAVPAASKRKYEPREVVAAYSADDAPHALVDPPAWSAAEPLPPLRAAAHPAAADGVWIDEIIPEVANPPQAAQAPPRPRPAAPPRPQVARPAAPVPAAAELVEIVPHLTWREWAVRHRNPLLAVGLVCLVLGAVAVKRWRQRLEDLPRVAELGRTDGFRKLDTGEFFAAKKILADAAAAVDALGGRFEGADEIRQAAREAAIFTDLVPKSLEDLVEEAATFRDVSAWSGHFAEQYRGRSILVETTITAVPDPGKPGSRYEDAYRILAGRGPKAEARGQFDFTGFELFDLSQPKVGETKLFGARLAALEFNLAENAWFLTLEPDSGVYMTHAAALEAFHWPGGEPAEEARP